MAVMNFQAPELRAQLVWVEQEDCFTQREGGRVEGATPPSSSWFNVMLFMALMGAAVAAAPSPSLIVFTSPVGLLFYARAARFVNLLFASEGEPELCLIQRTAFMGKGDRKTRS